MTVDPGCATCALAGRDVPAVGLDGLAYPACAEHLAVDARYPTTMCFTCGSVSPDAKAWMVHVTRGDGHDPDARPYRPWSCVCGTENWRRDTCRSCARPYYVPAGNLR